MFAIVRKSYPNHPFLAVGDTPEEAWFALWDKFGTTFTPDCVCIHVDYAPDAEFDDDDEGDM